ncbi:MAG: zinc ribbon domain-containing protein [Candidatus Omnitrophota bacterium]
MPIYEYRCRECGKTNEFLVGVGSDKAEIRCSFCKSTKLDKLFSGAFIPAAGSIIGSQSGKTCCGRAERCQKPPCSEGGSCRR